MAVTNTYHECAGGGIAVDRRFDATFDHPLYFADKGWVVNVGVWTEAREDYVDGLVPVNFCPWCGVELPSTPPAESNGVVTVYQQ